jgi:hypothetical protein
LLRIAKVSVLHDFLKILNFKISAGRNHPPPLALIKNIIKEDFARECG